ncbi:MAG: hypothetical protein M1817_006677 [Caeruleum heppii]|nr:MAG: hypothetical protein M1817_006677 [Caeruleum heppii]
MPHAETSNLASCSSSSVSRTSSLLKKAPPVPPARRLSQKQRTRDEAPHLTRSMSSQSSAIPKPEERVWSLHARNSLPAPPPPPVRSSTIKKTPPPASPRRRPAQRIQPSTARPPPPPPPRRHRGSSGSRRDQPPSPLAVQEDPRSGEAGGTEEIDAINQDDDMSARAEPVSAEPSNTGGADILADISELQREVDALTERCKAGLNTEGL